MSNRRGIDLRERFVEVRVGACGWTHLCIFIIISQHRKMPHDELQSRWPYRYCCLVRRFYDRGLPEVHDVRQDGVGARCAELKHLIQPRTDLALGVLAGALSRV